MTKIFKKLISVILVAVIIVSAFSFCSSALSSAEESSGIYSVSIQNSIELKYRSTAQLNVDVDCSDGTEYTVSWTSSDLKLVSVDENGVIRSEKHSLWAMQPVSVGGMFEFRFAPYTRAEIICTVTDMYGYSVDLVCNVTVKCSFAQRLLKFISFGAY